mmetsp:Transcript_22581/g.48758  ORF Transcript_22581/g.48758 Transcript_22581/m.48758 type:complete len:205 (-) Transcript_22581:225-839(-)
MQILLQPRSRIAGVFATTSPISSRAWKSSARGSSTSTAGGARSTLTIVSVTSSVRVALWKKAVSPKAPTSLKRSGPSTSSSISSLHCGNSVLSSPRVGRVRSRAPDGNPSSGSQTGSGNDHWPGCSQTVALGKAREAGPASALCSRPTVPSTMCFTSPCASSRTRIILMHSAVGATGLCTHKPPSCSLITVCRTGTFTLTTPCI